MTVSNEKCAAESPEKSNKSSICSVNVSYESVSSGEILDLFSDRLRSKFELIKSQMYAIKVVLCLTLSSLCILCWTNMISNELFIPLGCCLTGTEAQYQNTEWVTVTH